MEALVLGALALLGGIAAAGSETTRSSSPTEGWDDESRYIESRHSSYPTTNEQQNWDHSS